MGPARNESETETGKVLSAEELDIENSENVVELDEGRYVIGAEGQPSVTSVPDETGSASASASDSASSPPMQSSDSGAPTASTPGSAPEAESPPQGLSVEAAETGSQPPQTQQEPNIDSRDVRRWLEEDLDDVDSRYGFHISAKSEGAIGHQQLFSDDVGTVFDGQLMWYAQQVDRSTAVEDVLGILLMESNVRVRYSPRCFHGVLETHGLAPDDSIADLFKAIRDANGVVFPPETDE
ncbi:hypothetical protein ACFFQF_13990 [Haladaptatus pallidirubidus]|uniref:Uncharacterized protein n=1 Tax=Haladaptatus pallidirubidus TaxID=1008152 RepID=A0AAV3UCY5_9EURY|nr:hypothetical protein [Haladaptatus pallidirubidus]